jgi:hypothetical protein
MVRGGIDNPALCSALALDALAESRATGRYPMMQADGEWEVIDLP